MVIFFLWDLIFRFSKDLLGWIFEFTASFVIHLLFLLCYGLCSTIIVASIGLLIIVVHACSIICLLTSCSWVFSSICISLISHRLLILFFLFPNYIHYGVLQCFFVFIKSILFPSVICDLNIILVSLHTAIKYAVTKFVIGNLIKF